MSHSDLILRIKEILLPLVATEDEREALLIDAFYLRDPLLHGIKLEGAPGPFASKLIKKLLDYGCLPGGEHSLAHLLLSARHGCGVDKHAEIDELVSIINMLNRPSAATPEPDETSAPLPLPTPVQTPIQTIDTPRDERHPTVFISYARADAEIANQLIADLNVNGHACWIDTTSIKGGEVWIRAIADGIINSYALVPIITMNALESSWMRKEILWAQERKKLVIPWILEDVKKEPGFLPLADCQGITLYNQARDGAFKNLLRSLPQPEAIEVSPAIVIKALPSAPPEHTSRKMELAYLDRLRLEELLNTERYTQMAGATRQRQPEMRAVFEFLPMGKERELHRESRRFENAVEEMRATRQAVLLGEPGGGKTTTIWKLADDLVEAALKDREAPIPLLIRLGRWTDAGQSLKEFIGSQLGDLGEYLDLLLKERRAALLLDGLNELPAGQRSIKYPQVKRLIKQNPDLLAVVSCRELDYREVDLGFDLINITPLDPPRIREFAERYLGKEKGEALFWKLAGQEAKNRLEQFLRQFADKLSEPERVFWVEPQLPGDQRWGYGWRENDNTHWQNWLRLRETPSSLMVLARNPYMLLMLTSVYRKDGHLPDNRGDLFRRFVEELLKREEELLKREQVSKREQATLMDGLAKIAYTMQSLRTDDEAGDALTVLPKDDVNEILGERLLYLAGSASILSVGEQVRFTHQLLQEYFAARYMDLEIRAGRLKASKIWLPDRWWQRTNWEEAAILLAGLYSDDCSRIVAWVAEANPEVAAMCIERSGAQIAEATVERLRTKWIPRLTDLKGDPKPEARAAVGRALGMTRLDNRKGVGSVIGANNVSLPDIDWLEIPAGEFQYGDESEYAAKPQKLTLPTFQISRYPVTYAQFQTFLDDPEGFADPRWFEGMAARDGERRMDEQYFEFANHPRETVSWYQAMAFCRWFSWRLGGGYDLEKVAEWAVRLPTEYEWEKAARGIDGRIYPYEGDFDAAKGNTYETGLRQTSAVGIFPNGASPYGVMDMSGNVWEWCLSDYDKPALETRKENLRTDKIRVLRGGSWFDNQDFARAVYRDSYGPDDRDGYVGFRVMLGMRPPSL